jgi:hypothetical protein
MKRSLVARQQGAQEYRQMAAGQADKAASRWAPSKVAYAAR